MTKYQKSLWIIFAFAILLRLSSLNYPYYWGDEVINSVWVSGHSLAEFKLDIPEGSILSLETIKDYQYPSSDKTALDIVRNLALEEPQNTPLNYVLLWYWLKVFGYSIANTRSLIAVFSALCIPLVYWLCQELFLYRKELTGIFAATFMAVSPVQVIYSHEARPFSLWCVMTLLSTIALLKSLRSNSSWLYYSLLSIFSFYTYPLALFTTAAHSVFILVREHFRLTTKLWKFAQSILPFVFCCAPWILLLLTTSRKMGNFRRASISLGDLAKVWTANFVRIFWDINANPYGDYEYILPFVLLLATLFAVSAVFMARNESVSTTTLVLGLIVMNVLPLVIPDLILGGLRSSITRYFFPAYLVIILPVSYFLAYKVSCDISELKKKLWRFFTIVLIMLGLVSCYACLTSTYWHSKGNNLEFIETANIVDSHSNAVVISDYSQNGFIRILTLGHMLQNNADLYMGGNKLDILNVTSQQKSAFLLTPSDAFISSLKEDSNFTVENLRIGRTNDLFLVSRAKN